MAEVADVKSNPRDGVENLVECSSIAPNQARGTILEQTAKSESRSRAVKPSPSNANNKDENQQIIVHDLDMVIEARKWIGVLVCRELDGNRYMGRVVNYFGETKLYKIDYDNDVSEEVDYQELQQIVAPPLLVSEYLQRIYPSWFSETEKEKKKRHQSDTKVPIHPRRYSPVQQPEPKKRKSKKPAGSGSASSYIPLAFRETRKDAYYYYY